MVGVNGMGKSEGDIWLSLENESSRFPYHAVHVLLGMCVCNGQASSLRTIHHLVMLIFILMNLIMNNTFLLSNQCTIQWLNFK